jgi:hypothetical protein
LVRLSPLFLLTSSPYTLLISPTLR